MEDYSAKLTAEPFLYNETKTIANFCLMEKKKRNFAKEI